MAKENDELQERTCRSCDRTYKYPMLKSTATRFYCEACMELSPEVRSTFEHYNKRLKKLTSQLAKLEKG
jgi:hypothetical protein